MKIGIITFHAVYNYGAVLQAYALENALIDMGCEAEIIDFRRKQQADYTSLYSNRNGIKSIIKNALLLPLHKKRKMRANKFETFFNTRLKLSAARYTEENQLTNCDKIYSTVIAGSDQVWNTTKKYDVSRAYFLDFIKDNKCLKVSYAASIGSASYEDLLLYREDIKKFSYISMREKRGCEIISKLINREVAFVLDPTLMLNEKHYRTLISESDYPVEGKYLLYYSLDGVDKKNRNFDILEKLAEKFGLKVKAILPERPFRYKNFDIINDVGIQDFLKLIQGAELICTNSFHGTALSIALQKPFFVLEKFDGKDDRKQTLLQLLDCKERQISDIHQINEISGYAMNLEEVQKRLQMERNKSKEFLENIIKMRDL